MTQLYLNNKPITKALARHILTDAMPRLTPKQVADLLDFALMGYWVSKRTIADYGLHIGESV